MRAIHGRLCVPFAFLAFLAWAAPVSAVDDEAKQEAKERFSKGVEFFNASEYGAALAEFHWAFEVSPHYMVLYNIARCYARLNKHIEAMKYFEQYLEEGGTKIGKKRLKEVEVEMSALVKIIAYLDITTGDVKGATIKVGEKVAGHTPLAQPVAVEPGPVTVSVDADGYRSESKEIVVPAGKTLPVSFELVWIVKFGTIEVASEAPKSVVYMDGKEMGKAPWKGKVKTGTHLFEVKAKGYTTASKEVVVEEDEVRTIDVTPVILGEPARLILDANVEGAAVFVEGIKMGAIPIKPLDLPPGPSHVIVKADGYIPFEGDIQLTTGEPVHAEVKLVNEKTGVHPGWFWTAASLAVAAGIGAGVTGIFALQKQDEYDKFLKDTAAGVEAGSEADLVAKEKRLGDEGKTLALTTDVLWGVVGAMGVTALTLAFFTRFKPPESRVNIALEPVITPELAAVAMSGTF
ncbi:MAG: PEGA domain-containing protein [Deltaproteobacteria bacterium]|nr:PEGA domain-containing protein [Deltaproteobacteria bacterium]